MAGPAQAMTEGGGARGKRLEAGWSGQVEGVAGSGLLWGWQWEAVWVVLGLRPWPRWRVGRRLCSAPPTRASYTPTPRRGSLPSQRVHGRRQSHPLALPHPLDAAVALGAPTRGEGTGCSGQKGTAATRSPAPQGHPSPASVRQRCQAEGCMHKPRRCPLPVQLAYALSVVAPHHHPAPRIVPHHPTALWWTSTAEGAGQVSNALSAAWHPRLSFIPCAPSLAPLVRTHRCDDPVVDVQNWRHAGGGPRCAVGRGARHTLLLDVFLRRRGRCAIHHK